MVILVVSCQVICTGQQHSWQQHWYNIQLFISPLLVHTYYHILDNDIFHRIFKKHHPLTNSPTIRPVSWDAIAFKNIFASFDSFLQVCLVLFHVSCLVWYQSNIHVFSINIYLSVFLVTGWARLPFCSPIFQSCEYNQETSTHLFQ